MRLANISVLEFLFTLGGLIGFVVTIWNLRDTNQDVRYVEDRERQATVKLASSFVVKLITVKANRRRERDRAVILFFYVVLGLSLMTRPPGGPGGRTSWAGILLGFILLGSEFLLTRQSILDRIDRATMLSTIVGPNRTIDEMLEAEVQQRRRATDPSPDPSPDHRQPST